MSTIDHTHLLIKFLARFLPVWDFVRLAYINHLWRHCVFGDAESWLYLLGRDFPQAWRASNRERHLVSHKASYISAFRTQWNWRTGRSLPPLFPTKRANRLLLVNDEGLVAEVTIREGCVRSWQVLNSSLVETDHARTPTVLEDGETRSVIDCALGPGASDATLLCGGIHGAWLEQIGSGLKEELVNSQGLTVHKVACDGHILAASTSGVESESLLLWDASRPDVLLGRVPKNSQTVGDAIGIHLYGSRAAVVFANGTVAIVDSRLCGASASDRNVTYIQPPYLRLAGLGEVQASLVSELSTVLAYSAGCLQFDNRVASDSDIPELCRWNVRNVSSLAQVNRSSIVAGMSQGWEGPIVILNDDGTRRRLLYSSERNYRVTALRTNSSYLAATCTDWNRLFIFSPQAFT